MYSCQAQNVQRLTRRPALLPECEFAPSGVFFCLFTLKRRRTTPSKTSHLVLPLTPMQPIKNWRGCPPCNGETQPVLDYRRPAGTIRTSRIFKAGLTSPHFLASSRLTTIFTWRPSFLIPPSPPVSSSSMSDRKAEQSQTPVGTDLVWRQKTSPCFRQPARFYRTFPRLTQTGGLAGGEVEAVLGEPRPTSCGLAVCVRGRRGRDGGLGARPAALILQLQSVVLRLQLLDLQLHENRKR